MTSSAGQTHVTIRQLEAADRISWSKMWSAYLTFYDTSLPQDIYDLTFNRLLSDHVPTMWGHIAEIDGTPAGLVHFILHDHCWRRGKVCYLQDLFTRANMRGRGVARALIQSVYDKADTHDAENTYWLTQEFNHDARMLYDRVGVVTPFIKYQRS